MTHTQTRRRPSNPGTPPPRPRGTWGALAVKQLLRRVHRLTPAQQAAVLAHVHRPSGTLIT